MKKTSLAFASALFLTYLWMLFDGIGWGLPEHWPSDEVTWLVSGMLSRDSLNPGYFYYSNLGIYLCYAPAQILEWIGFAPNDAAIGIACRSMSVLCFIASAVCSAHIVRLLIPTTTGIWAFLFHLSLGVFAHHARIATVNSAFFLAINAALYTFARVIVHRNKSSLYWSAFVVGLAIGTKYNALYLVPIVALLWFIYFRASGIKGFLIDGCKSASLTTFGFILSTPFALLDWPEFLRDFSALTEVEGPKFKNPISFTQYLESLTSVYVGTFLPIGIGIIALVSIASLFMLFRVKNKADSPTQISSDNIWWFYIISLIATLLSAVQNRSIGIDQPRYYLVIVQTSLPAMVLLLTFFFEKLSRFSSKARFTAVSIQISLLLLNLAGLYAFLAVYSLSPKNQTLKYLLEIEKQAPQTSISVIGYPGRSPFEMNRIRLPTTYFETMSPKYEVDRWEDYLSIIQSFLKNSNPELIIFEDIIIGWTVFLPKKYAQDYGRRLDYPNPGFAAWDEMLREAGYSSFKTIGYTDIPPHIKKITRNYPFLLGEGAGGSNSMVYVYKRR